MAEGGATGGAVVSGHEVVADAPRRPGTLRLLWGQTRYQNKIFWRTPISAFFTLIFPLILLVVFAAIFGSQNIDYLNITVAQFYAPALAVFSAASASYTNIGVGTAYQRDLGVLKRVHGTPLPAWIYLSGKVLSAVYIAAIAVAVMLTVGHFAYGVQFFLRTVPAGIVTFSVGVISFAALGLVVAAVSPNGNAATAIANATLLPLAFFSGVFIVANELPTWMDILGKVFPLKHFNDAFQAVFNPWMCTGDPATNCVPVTGPQFHWGDLAVMAVWGVVGMIVAVRYFKWESKPGGSSTRGRRREPTGG